MPSFFNIRRVLLILLSSSIFLSHNASTYTEERADFDVKIDGRTLGYKISFRNVLPMKSLLVESKEPFNLLVDGSPVASDVNTYRWTAGEEAGHHQLEIVNKKGQKILNQVFVLRSAKNVDKNGRLNGYRMGWYPSPLKGLESYRAPPGFIEVHQDMLDLPVSPHFRLGQFLCKQESAYPKYLFLRPRLLEKLELLLTEVNRAGIEADSFEVMSGYRTPWYNKSIGNVPNSRHVYGGAADIYIDVAPKNMYMDDVNKDGKINVADARWLYDLMEKLSKSLPADLRGGIGLYKSNAAHGPFVHVDVRGTRARWGL